MTRSAVSSLTSARVSAFSARETVPGCTRAARATSRRVTGPAEGTARIMQTFAAPVGEVARASSCYLWSGVLPRPLVRPPRDGVPVPRPPGRRSLPGRAARAAAVPDRRPPLVLRPGLGARARGDRLVLDRPAALRPSVRRPLAAVAAARRRRACGGRHRARRGRGALWGDVRGHRRERARRGRLPPGGLAVRELRRGRAARHGHELLLGRRQRRLRPR